MAHNTAKQADEDTCIKVQIMDQTSLNSLPSPFEPYQDSSPHPSNSNGDDISPVSTRNSGGLHDRAPEKKLTIFALQLAVLEKAASGLGTLGFVWATVVLLGGFAITLEKKDFWFITVILLIEGTRIFSRSHELEWQHQATWSLTRRSSISAIKSRSRLLVGSFKFIFKPFSRNSSNISNDVLSKGGQRLDRCNPLRSARCIGGACDMPQLQRLPHTSWVFISQNISRLFYWLQLLSATACVVLSLMRLVEQDFGESKEANRTNRNSALNIFYSLAFAEAMLFLAEKAFWEWKVSYCGLLEQVNNECQLGPSGMVSIRRFFYDAYSKCVTGSIFDGLKMDLVTFAEELLVSTSHDEQLIGVRILLALSTHQRFSGGTLRKVGTSMVIIERLIDMLNWKNPTEEEIRHSAAMIVSKLASKKQNALRLAGIPGAMESISSLLYCGPVSQTHDYNFSAFNLLGLLILKKLANDHDNCGKIGNTRGLLDKIIDFTTIGQGMHLKAVKRSLQLVKMLASTTGQTGLVFRREISEIVFTTSNVRNVLRHGGDHLELQRLGLEVVTNLAMDGAARERIGSTGGMVKELLRLFLQPGITHDQNAVRVEAGEALAMLVLENKENCRRVLKEENVLVKLVEALEDRIISINSSRILRNLCAFGALEGSAQLTVLAGFTLVLNGIMTERVKLVEVSLGLAAQILKFTSPRELDEELHNACISDIHLVTRLVQILASYEYPSIKVPRIRRFAIELAIEMMRVNNKNYVRLFTQAGMIRELNRVANTTSELECFNIFSGSVGLSKHDVNLDSLVDMALKLMSNI
ncbi:ARM repeat superfamily protein [Rhynchospora pubera]|uniref:ARM repeat superfamily protein n=1 Tax=Rhynchospora pubera TaxID=906938 RepID=A0AAV8GJU7_9POAL|nr:ARM repeat superfamily protein [Rhynchospora pubera]